MSVVVGLPTTPKQMVVVVRVGMSYGDFFPPLKLYVTVFCVIVVHGY